MEEIKINKEKLYKNTGIEFENMKDCIYYMQRIVDKLEMHNKNYTKEQYYNIVLLRDILETIEIEKI